VQCVQFSPDGRYVAVGCDNTAQIFDVNSGTRVASFFQREDDETRANVDVIAMGFSLDGRYLGIADSSGTVRISDIETEETRKLPLGLQQGGAKDMLYCVAFSQDLKLLAYGSEDATLELVTINFGSDGSSMSLGKRLSLEFEGPVYLLAFSSDGQLVAGRGRVTHVCIWDAKSGNVLRRLSPIAPIMGFYSPRHSMAFSPPGTKLLADEGDSIKLWEVPDQNGPTGVNSVEEITEFISKGTGDRVTSMGWSLDGELLLWGDQLGFVYSWDMKGIPQTVLKGHDRLGTCLEI
jgi:glucose repression regulatory protein TUP1